MTVSSEILLQLSHLTGVVMRLATPDQHTRLSSDERKAVMQHLKASVDVLATLAEVVRMEASRGGAVAETTDKGDVDTPVKTTEKGEGSATATSKKYAPPPRIMDPDSDSD